MKKKILIIGASILQLPAIKKAKEMGLEVAVADYNSNAVGIKYADHYYNASTIDINAIVEVAKEFKPDGIMTLATDMPMRSIAVASKELGLPGISYETALKSTDKGEMIKAFKEHNVASPWFYLIENRVQYEQIKPKLTFPCIMKPDDNSGSRGVVLIEDSNKLDEAYKYSQNESRNGSVIIEEYLIGDEISVEVIVYKGEIKILQVTDKLTTGAPHFVEMGHTQPSKFTGKDLEAIHALTQKAVKSVGIEDGAAHVEIMVTKNGPKMIELGARMGGDCITTHLVPLSTGIDMIKATIDIALGEEPNLQATINCGSAIRFFDTDKGIIKDIENIENAKNIDGIKEIALTKKVGEKVKEINSSLDRVGYVISQGKSSKEAVDICERALSLIKFNVIK